MYSIEDAWTAVSVSFFPRQFYDIVISTDKDIELIIRLVRHRQLCFIFSSSFFSDVLEYLLLKEELGQARNQEFLRAGEFSWIRALR